MFLKRRSRKAQTPAPEAYHDFIPIYAYAHGADQDVVRWCSVCGAIRVDSVLDNHVLEGNIRPVQYPLNSIHHYGR